MPEKMFEKKNVGVRFSSPNLRKRAFSAFPSCSWGAPEKGRKRVKKAGKGRFPEHPLSGGPKEDNQQEASITRRSKRPKFGKKMPKIITSHDVLEPLKQVLSASRDVRISG